MIIKIVKHHLFSKQADGFLNIGKIHALYIPDDRNHQTLRGKKPFTLRHLIYYI